MVERHAHVLELLPQRLIIPGFSTTEQSTKAYKELIQIMNNPGPKTPFTIRERQLHAINRLAKMFNNIKTQQTDKPNT